MNKIIFHIDVNSAFLSWEAVYRLRVLKEEDDLRDVPSAVGGDSKKRHGIILARSTPAKEYGIKTGGTIHDALTKCPDLVLVPPHHDLYDRSSKALMELLNEFSPCVEKYSVDEAFCDMTGTTGIYGEPLVAANILRERISNELGFTVNIGVSSNKLLAKMASGFKKPNRVHTLFPNEIKEKMWILPVEELFYVGKATKLKLHNLGIYTIGELAHTDLDILVAHFKKHGEVIHAFANGISVSDVESVAIANKGYGNSTTVASDIDNASDAKMVLLSLSENVATRLRADGVTARVIAVSIVDFEFRTSSHQATLIAPTSITNEIYQESCKLFDELWDGRPLRSIGVHSSKVEDGDNTRQLSFFDMDKYDKLSKLDAAVDVVREKYGGDSIMRARFLDSQVYHMIGGASPQKRNPDHQDDKKTTP